jgi:hypothetical protein
MGVAKGPYGSLSVFSYGEVRPLHVPRNPGDSSGVRERVVNEFP